MPIRTCPTWPQVTVTAKHSGALVLLLTLALGGGARAAQPEPPRAPARGPLRVHPSNPRYFTDDGRRAVYLVGSHTWDSLQDLGESDPPAPFDFDAYLDFLVQRDHNFIRLWRWELVHWDTRANHESSPKCLVASPHPWARTGPGEALDGKPRFSLTRFNDAYFQRLRSRVIAARDRGVYVSVMLFEGWGLQHVADAWKAHPFHPDNHVEGLRGDADGDGHGLEVHTLTVPTVTRIQEAYVRQVIDTVNDLDNVLFEISNESGAYSIQWQEHFVRFIHDYEKAKPRQHPVGVTFPYSRDLRQRGVNAQLFASSADWISPNPDAGAYNYRTNPPAADGHKVILTDTDHLWGIGGDVAWVWKSFMRGLNPLFMDPYRQGVLTQGSETRWEPLRRALGVTRRVAERVPLAAMKPHGELASSGFCLADPGRSYLVYLPTGGEVAVDLSDAPGALQVEWIRPVEGGSTSAGRVAGGAKRSLPAPFPGEAVVHLSVPTPGSIPGSGGLTFIDTSFENASPVWYDLAPDGVIQVHLLYDHERDSPNRAAGHIHFLLHAAPGARLILEFKNLDNIWNGTPGSVARELKTLVVSANGRDWRAVPTESLPTNRVQLAVEMPGPRLYVARVEPYRLSDLDRLLAAIRKHRLVEITPIGRSVEGRELEIVRIGSRRAPGRVFLRARAHPWESGGNWVLEGLIQRLLRGDADAREYLQRYCVYLLPMANKDGVARGMTRFNLQGKDLNRNWDQPADPLLAPENAALERWLDTMNSSGQRPHLALELHNDGGGLLHLSRPAVPGLEQHLARMATLEKLLRSHTWFTEGATRATFRNPGSLGDGWLERFGIDAVVHEFNCNWIAGLKDYPSARHWRDYGAALAGVFHDYFTAVNP